MNERDEYLLEWVRKAEATVKEAQEAISAMKTVRRFIRSRLGLENS